MGSHSLDATIGFVGAGQMARALAAGFVDTNIVAGQQIVAADPSSSAARLFEQAVRGARILDTNRAVAGAADIIFLAVKPQTIAVVLPELCGISESDKLFVSIVAGVPLSSLTVALGSDRIIRVMPNTPCLVGRGAAGYCLGSGATADDGKTVERLLESVSISVRLDEHLLDAVTGLSGSGPAFVYQVIEALSDGGVLVGLPRDVSLRLAAQTVRGAAEMVIESGEHPAVLKDRVTSPGGTTIRGLEALEEHGFRSALIAAVSAATERSRQLGCESVRSDEND